MVSHGLFALPRDFQGQTLPATVSYIYISSFDMGAENLYLIEIQIKKYKMERFLQLFSARWAFDGCFHD